MFLLRILLFPFAVLYDAITSFRNRMYDLKLKPSVQFDIPVICVGNLSAGGTGKTPVIEYLIRLLSPKQNIAVLSRGYKRKTKGFRIASSDDTPDTLGDEPYQIYRKFGSKVCVAVGEDRVLAIPDMLQSDPSVEVILMDDGYQHRSVSPSFSIVLTEFDKPFFEDFLLPAGRLREARKNVNRADAVIVTKCPDALDDKALETFENKISSYTDRPVFFTRIHYGECVSFGNHGLKCSEKVVLVTGIANADVLYSFIRSKFTITDHLEFADHHHYTDADLKKIESAIADTSSSILTTEKDMVKLMDSRFQKFTARLPFFYLPIEVEFVKDGKKFDELMLQSTKPA